MPSSVVASFHHDPLKQVLTVVFTSGMVYKYHKVPEKIYNEMKNAFSKGVYLNEKIKGQYPFEKME